MNAIAIILARGGSKGVKGKNVTPIAGRRCIAWTIDAALAAAGVSRVIVSSDCPRALREAREHGVETIERPRDLASDTARIDDAARHAVSTAAPEAGPTQALVILYANVPVRPAGLIDRSLELLASSGCDSVQSYARVGKHHPWWTARVGEDGRVGPWEGEVLNHGVFRRQDLPAAYIPDGGVIALTRTALFCEVPGVQAGPHAFFGRDRRGIINNEGDVIDIDSPIDVMVADAVLRERGEEAASAAGGQREPRGVVARG